MAMRLDETERIRARCAAGHRRRHAVSAVPVPSTTTRRFDGAGADRRGVFVARVRRRPRAHPLGLVETHGHAVPGAWLIENPGFVSGGSTLWLAGLLGMTQAEVFPLALNAPPGSEGVLFLPALSGATAPRWNDRMRGGLLGLAMNHTPAHVARAVLEGCAFRCATSSIDSTHSLSVEAKSHRRRWCA